MKRTVERADGTRETVEGTLEELAWYDYMAGRPVYMPTCWPWDASGTVSNVGKVQVFLSDGPCMVAEFYKNNPGGIAGICCTCRRCTPYSTTTFLRSGF